MFRLVAHAYARLSPEAANVAEQFLRALPPFARQKLSAVRLFGVQARHFEPDAPFDFLIVTDDRSLELKTAVAIATSASENGGLYTVTVTLATVDELESPPSWLARALQNARREGLDLWRREPAVAGARVS